MSAPRPREDQAHRRRGAHAFGLRAETLAALRLRLTGWRVLDRRFLGGGGEIDIVALRGDCVAFVEVKARSTLDEARASITPDKRRRMRRAANAWLARNPWAAGRTLRADAVFIGRGGWPRHVTNVFDLAD